MTTVSILLRHNTPALDEDGEAIVDGEGRGQFVYAQPDEVDLNALSPRARALAEAVAASPLKTATDVWMESDDPIRERVRDWQHWYTEEQANQRERRPWRGWSKFKATSQMTAVEYLEKQAAKIPAGWHVLGSDPHHRVPEETEMTSEQVRDYLKRAGRFITAATWRAYVARGQAPRPVRHVGRTPLWDASEIRSYATQGR